MTSKERHEARYQRRRAERERKKRERSPGAYDFDKVFTFAHMYRSAMKCYRGVSWKASVQAYKCRGGINVARKVRQIREGDFRFRPMPSFIRRERGRERPINSIHIEDRVPQKCLSLYALKPVLHRGLLWDNYASQDNKGTSRARARLKCMLERHIRRHGTDGGMIVFDFSRFFDSIRHDLIREVLEKQFDDGRIVEMNMHIVRTPGVCLGKTKKQRFAERGGGVGIVLGSENSQDFAISVPSAFDHLVKDALRAEGYGRYMDDGWIIDADMNKLTRIFASIKEKAAELGFKLNEKKSRIIRFGEPFEMLKRKYSFTPSGGIVLRPVRESAIRERRKLKRIYRRTVKGTMPTGTGRDSLTAWEASVADSRAHRAVQSMRRLYNRLFLNYELSGGRKCTS